MYNRLDIRGMTAASKGSSAKKEKFKKTVSRADLIIYGPQQAQSAGINRRCVVRSSFYLLLIM